MFHFDHILCDSNSGTGAYLDCHYHLMLGFGLIMFGLF